MVLFSGSVSGVSLGWPMTQTGLGVEVGRLIWSCFVLFIYVRGEKLDLRKTDSLSSVGLVSFLPL